MRTELAGLDAAVAATPPDPITQPGDGIGIYSPGFKRLGQIQQLVSKATKGHCCGWANALSKAVVCS
jgi:hypothetical protein